MLPTIYFIVIPIMNCFIEIYVSFRQIFRLRKGKYSEAKEIFKEEEFNKACSYSKDKLYFGIFSLIYSTVKSCLFLIYCNQIYSKYFSNLKLSDSSFFIFYAIADMISNIPFDLFSDFVIERKHGFNNKTLHLFFKDFCLMTLLTIAIGYPTSSIAFYIINKYSSFYIYLWLFISVFTVFMTVIHPTYIAPLFNDFKLLENKILKEKIEKMAEKINFPLGKIFVIDGSKRSGHSNAYFTGLGKIKQIVFYDTLFKNMSDEEIVAILCHELGHWKKCHVYSLLCMGLSEMFVLFYLFNIYINKFSSGSVVVKFIEFSALYAGLELPLSLCKNSLVRVFERQADLFAINLGHGENLKNALKKLHQENKGAPIVDTIYSAVNYTHPHTLERLAMIDANMKKKE